MYLFACKVYFIFSFDLIHFDVCEIRKNIRGAGCRDYLRASSGKLFPLPGWLAVGNLNHSASQRQSTPSLSPAHLLLSILTAPSLIKASIHLCLCPCKSILTGVPVSCLFHLVNTPVHTASQWPLLPAPAHLPPAAFQKKIIKTLVNQGKRSPTIFLFITGA